ncbi:hypothetical protein GQR58_010537 [Nymphon striatum]|nr:hypothetical protein GQR58_010537 [Nymphon striatum]
MSTSTTDTITSTSKENTDVEKTISLPEIVSALLDDEVGTFEQRRVLNELKAEDGASETLHTKLSTYALIGETMRSGKPASTASTDFLSGIHDQLESEPEYSSHVLDDHLREQNTNQTNSWLRPVGGFAMAASVAALAVIGFQNYFGKTDDDTKERLSQAEMDSAVVVSADSLPGTMRAETKLLSAATPEQVGNAELSDATYKQADAQTRSLLKSYVDSHMQYASTSAFVPSIRVNGVERERVVRLNEQGSEVSRELKGFSLASIPVIRPHMEKVYSFDVGRENRVANIPCRIITARPKDRVRYLQKYCIDTNSGLLLDYMLVGKSHKPVEQFMFTSIEIGVTEGQGAQVANAKGDEIIESLPLDVQLQLNAASPVQLEKSVTPVLRGTAKSKSISIAPQAKSVRQISSSELDDGWVMEPLPAGFGITQAPSMKHSPDADAVTKHYVVSDGLSSLSVFVSPLSASVKTPKHAIQVNSGALNLLAREKDNHLITVVGEVPESTLRSVVKSLRKKVVQENERIKQ